MATTLKVILLGESGVGKTTIVGKFTTGKFYEDLTTSLSTQFISETILLEKLNQTIKFDIWDILGAYRFRSLAKTFYKDSDVICFCYDPTNKRSFEDIKDYWYEKEIKIEIETDPILVIVATKKDLEKKKEVEDEEGIAFAKEINGIFQSTSAKSDISIKSLFENIARKYFDPSYDCNEIENKKKNK